MVNQICPVCKINGNTSQLELYQINLATAVYMCNQPNCAYPEGHSWIQVERSLWHINESAEGSDDEDIDAEAKAAYNLFKINESRQGVGVSAEPIKNPIVSNKDNLTLEFLKAFEDSNVAENNDLQAFKDTLKFDLGLTVKIKIPNLTVEDITRDEVEDAFLKTSKASLKQTEETSLPTIENLFTNESESMVTINNFIQPLNTENDLKSKQENIAGIIPQINPEQPITDAIDIEQAPIIFAELEDKNLLASPKQLVKVVKLDKSPTGLNLSPIKPNKEIRNLFKKSNIKSSAKQDVIKNQLRSIYFQQMNSSIRFKDVKGKLFKDMPKQMLPDNIIKEALSDKKLPEATLKEGLLSKSEKLVDISSSASKFKEFEFNSTSTIMTRRKQKMLAFSEAQRNLVEAELKHEPELEDYNIDKILDEIDCLIPGEEGDFCSSETDDWLKSLVI